MQIINCKYDFNRRWIKNRQKNTSQTNNADPVFRAIKKYANHPSILEIKRKMSDKGLGFSFKYITRNKITKEIQNLDSKKGFQESDIPVKLIKNLYVILTFIHNNFNNSLFGSCFPSELKNANVTPVFLERTVCCGELSPSKHTSNLFKSLRNVCLWSNQLVILNPRKFQWNWIAFYRNSLVISPGCYITRLDATLDDLQTRPLRQILLYLRKNGLVD